MPSPAGCGNFVANKEDGCEARLYAEPGCVGYLNTAVFIAEDRAVGGVWRSMVVQCGIPAPDPATLGEPPLQNLINGGKTGQYAARRLRRRQSAQGSDDTRNSD